MSRLKFLNTFQLLVNKKVVFIFGLEFGRIVSFVLDGLPHWLLIVCAILKLVFGMIALTL